MLLLCILSCWHFELQSKVRASFSCSFFVNFEVYTYWVFLLDAKDSLLSCCPFFKLPIFGIELNEHLGRLRKIGHPFVDRDQMINDLKTISLPLKIKRVINCTVLVWYFNIRINVNFSNITLSINSFKCGSVSETLAQNVALYWKQCGSRTKRYPLELMCGHTTVLKLRAELWCRPTFPELSQVPRKIFKWFNVNGSLI